MALSCNRGQLLSLFSELLATRRDFINYFFNTPFL